MTCEAMAVDIGALIAHLGFAKADVMGYSLGGGWAAAWASRDGMARAAAPPRRSRSCRTSHYDLLASPLLVAVVEPWLAA